ncbi:MAG: alanine racemase [Chloroflexota bacterium]|nr:alanine racemase [Chloroflexota bacterium]
MPALRSTVADVDLDAIAHNMHAVATHGEQVIAVVKADAYGHGYEAVGRTLVDEGAAMLAVFTVDEGALLRRSGIEAPILILGGITEPAETEIVTRLGLTVTVWDLDRARLLSSAAGTTARVHVKVDTGLMRLGAPLEAAVERIQRIRALPNLAVDGVFTHFATADEENDSFTVEQVRRFESVLAALDERPAFVHAAASAGAVAVDTRSVCNAVRPGLALYGLHAAPHLATIDLRPALEWRSRVHRVAWARAGAGVSYGHEYRLARDGRIATVPVGYGDGLPRAAGRHARVLVRGRALPIAGRVAMDLIMLDVTDVPDVREGDEVVLIGEQDGARRSAEDLAEACGTINYEVVTNIRPRVARRYHRGGRVVATRTLADGIRWL